MAQAGNALTGERARGTKWPGRHGAADPAEVGAPWIDRCASQPRQRGIGLGRRQGAVRREGVMAEGQGGLAGRLPCARAGNRAEKGGSGSQARKRARHERDGSFMAAPWEKRRRTACSAALSRDFVAASRTCIKMYRHSVPAGPVCTAVRCRERVPRGLLDATDFDEGLERVAGIEPASQAWKASALPLSYTR